MADVVINRGIDLLADSFLSRSPLVDERTASKIEFIFAVISDGSDEAEKRLLNEQRVKRWLERTKDLCYDLMDALEEWKLLQQQAKKVPFLVPIFFKRSRSHRVQGIVYELKALVEELVEEIRPPRLAIQIPHETYSFVVESDIHGRDHERATLIDKIINTDADVIQYISIVGVAGIGKTALAQLVYNSVLVQEHFHLRGWICVSKLFNLLHIATSILKSLTHTDVRGRGAELESLFQRIRDIIGGKRYLFVLDSVWTKDYFKWEQLKALFNCGARGSTVLITTREVAAARAAGSRETDILHLSNLSEQDCCSIIRDVAFRTPEDGTDTEIFVKEFGRDITEKCHGVPLNVKSIGCILRTETSMRGWKYVMENYVPEIEFESLFTIQDDNWHERERQPTTSLVRVATMHGRDDERRTLIGALLNNDGQAQNIQFISIVGKPGIGKTALAQLVYNDSVVVDSFDSRAWVFVGEQFDLKHIVEASIESLTSESVNNVELEVLQFRFRQIVERKTCLFVLDDVWNEDEEKWRVLKNLFTLCGLGSKILITTRNRTVADATRSEPTNILRLSVLSDSACWSIIKDQAFSTSIKESYIEKIFNEVGRDIVKKCDGVPIIAKSLGGILRSRNSIEQWREVLRSDVWKLADLRSSFMLSYSLLPPVLKQCLLYCSIFPKNYSIDVDKLIKLWMAQDFVSSSEDEMEREGWRYVQTLVGRSIFQEFEQDGNGDFKCKLEGGMSDFINFLAQNECHTMLLGYEKEPGENPVPTKPGENPVPTNPGENPVPTKPRHCTLNIAADTSLPESIAYAKKLYTLMILSDYSSVDPTNLARLLSHMKIVRALNLSSCSIKELPLTVGKLLFLRYLDLSFNRDLKKLPEEICNLFNLQTLNLNGCDSLRKLPKGIGKLIKLRHLEILWTTSLSYLPKGIASLTSLRTLNRFFGICGAGSRACNLGDLESLNKIRGFMTIDGLGAGVSEAAKAGLKNKKDLIGVELWFSVVGSESDDEGVLEALEPPPELQCLGIFYYRGKLFPKWMTALEKLTHLMLADCSKCNILPPLWKLPSLESLVIKNMPNVKKVGSEFLGIGLDDADGDGEEGSSSTVAFPKLQKLRFQMLSGWEEWAGISGDANIMPSLSSLSIVNCKKLRAIPDYIKVKQNLNCNIKECPILEKKHSKGSIMNEKTIMEWTAQRKHMKV